MTTEMMMRSPPSDEKATMGEMLYFLGLITLGLILLYYGLVDLHRRHHPPPNPNPYIDEIYKGN
jgi:hypothetical protein